MSKILMKNMKIFWITSKNPWLWVVQLLYFIVFKKFLGEMGSDNIILGFLFAVTWITNSETVDSRNKMEEIYFSLGITRKEIVRAGFFFSLIITALGLVYLNLLNLLLIAVHPVATWLPVGSIMPFREIYSVFLMIGLAMIAQNYFEVRYDPFTGNKLLTFGSVVITVSISFFGLPAVIYHLWKGYVDTSDTASIFMYVRHAVDILGHPTPFFITLAFLVIGLTVVLLLCEKAIYKREL
ncbi:MAG: ABC-2 transporter permease [Candidatus Cloacimonetes bacterium]|nr:ABC-2 transporter permease [Candidatus Cloacimonadota bacterium]